MEELAVCRICLSMDVKMYDLQSQPLNLYFASAIGSNLTTIDNCPPYACFECAALVKKFHFFKRKCLKSQDLLSCLVDHNIKITATKLKEIDRESVGLSSKLAKQSLASGSFPQFNKEEFFNQGPAGENNVNDEPTVENISVKQEPEEPPMCYDDDVFIKQEPSFENVEPDIDVTTCDNDKDHDFLLHDENSSNDDGHELLLERDLIKVEDYEIVDNDILNMVTDNMDVSTEPQVTKPAPNKVVPKKSKRIPNKLIDKLLDDVTVTELTLEEQIEELNKRKESTNYINSPIKCELCFKGFGDSVTWKRHLQKHSPSAGPEECPVCKLRFQTVRCMGKHWRRHLTKYACKYCPHVSSDPSQAKIHLGQHKGVEYKCKRCDLKFTVLTTYLSHVRIKHSSEYTCDECGGPFVSKQGLYRHKVMVHNYDKGIDSLHLGADVEDETPWEEEYETIRASTSNTQQQITTTIRNDSLICREISNGDDVMKTPQNVRGNKKTTKEKLQFPVNCEYCSKKIHNVRAYRLHYRVHNQRGLPASPRKNYQCRDCGKGFEYHTNLLYHMRSHTGEKLYKCNLCNKKFYRLYELQSHEKSHSDDRAYICDYCHRGFKFRSAIKKHIAIHNSEKPNQCSICNKTFTTLSEVNDHVINIHAHRRDTYNRQLRSTNN